MNEQLQWLSEHNFVTIETTPEPGVWSLMLVPRKGGYSSRTYRGDLVEIVWRARRGEEPEGRSR